MSMWSEFKAFALKGNVVDLAIGVVIGAAFGKVVSSLVSDIIMPLVSLLTGGVSFNNLKITLRAAHDNVPALTLNYGTFIDTIINLLIIAASIFFVIKAMNKVRNLTEKSINGLIKKPEEEIVAEAAAAAAEPAAPKAPELSAEQQLLVEIRDLLKAQVESNPQLAEKLAQQKEAAAK